MLYVGIDNGRSGAMFLINGGLQYLDHSRFVVDGNGFLDHRKVRETLTLWHHTHGDGQPLDIYIETAGPRRGDGLKKLFGIGKHAASIHAGVTDFMGHRVRCGDMTPRGRVSYVAPSTWVHALGLTVPKGTPQEEKKRARVLAVNLFFGTQVSDHNIADAGLIAAYGASTTGIQLPK